MKTNMTYAATQLVCSAVFIPVDHSRGVFLGHATQTYCAARPFTPKSFGCDDVLHQSEKRYYPTGDSTTATNNP